MRCCRLSCPRAQSGQAMRVAGGAEREGLSATTQHHMHVTAHWGFRHCTSGVSSLYIGGAPRFPHPKTTEVAYNWTSGNISKARRLASLTTSALSKTFRTPPFRPSHQGAHTLARLCALQQTPCPACEISLDRELRTTSRQAGKSIMCLKRGPNRILQEQAGRASETRLTQENRRRHVWVEAVEWDRGAPSPASDVPADN